jgi:DNA invertase Pin-like site-specific DNA recombinase
VSTDRQERSIDEQKESIRAAALRDGVHLLENGTWCEDEAISGSILDRPGLKKLLDLCRTRKDITDVYFWKRNRVARSIDPLDGMNIEREIEQGGKHLHFVQGIQKTGNKMLDFIASGLEYAEAGQYLVNLSADTSRGLIPLTSQGFDAGRPTPYGYDRLVVDRNGNALYTIRHADKGVHHQIFPDGHVQVYANGSKPSKDESARSKLVVGAPERVKVVRRIFEACGHGEKGIRSIVEDLNADGVPSPRGGKWSVGTVRAILRNPVYYGANVWNVRSFSKYHRIEGGAVTPLPEPTGRSVNWNDETHWVVGDEEHGFPPIISKELFDLAQAKRAERNNPFRRGNALAAAYYLSGLAVCTCGHNLQGHTTTSGKRNGHLKNHYYTCGGFVMKGRTVCKHYLLRRDSLEKPVFEALGRRLKMMAGTDYLRERVKAELANQSSPNTGSAETWRTKIADVEVRMKRWEEAIERGLNLDVAAAKLNDLSKEKAALEAKLRTAQAAGKKKQDAEVVVAQIMAGLDNLEDVLAQGSVAEAKAVLRAYIGRIEVDPFNGKARIGFLRLPIRAFLSRQPSPETARVSGLAGAGFEPAAFGL